MPWNSKKPLVWLNHSEREISTYSQEFDRLRNQLDAAIENPQTKNNAQKVAQISQIQNQLTADNLNALNALVKSVDLGTLLIGNRKPDVAKLWVPWQLPEGKHVLDESKMEDVTKFLYNLSTCFTESGKDHVQFAHSASFSWNIPRDADDTPLNREQALVFWQWYNHSPVDKAIVALYDSLHIAQAAAAAEELLNNGS